MLEKGRNCIHWCIGVVGARKETTRLLSERDGNTLIFYIQYLIPSTTYQVILQPNAFLSVSYITLVYITHTIYITSLEINILTDQYCRFFGAALLKVIKVLLYI